MLRTVLLLCLMAWSSPAQELPDHPRPHRFFDRTNKILFSGLVVTRSLDYHSTYLSLKAGNIENQWPRGAGRIVKSHAGFAAYQAANAGITIGVAYWLHRKGHHHWERAASIIQITWIGALAVRNYQLSRRQYPRTN